MPRFFPSFGNRSRQNREQRPHDEYDRYDDYGQQHQQSPRVPTTAWSRVVPNGKSREHLNPDSSWDEDVFLERPDSYTGHGAYPNGTRIPVPGASSASSSSTAYLNQDDGHDNTHHRQRRPSRPAMMMPVRDRDDAAYLSDSTAAEEEYDNGRSGHYAPDNTIPIVQRESSLTRLQEAFADHGLSAGSTRPVTELNLPQQQSTPIFQSAPVSLSGGPGPSTMAYSMGHSGIQDPYAHHIQSRSSPHHGVLPPVGQIYGNATAELRNVYPEQHLPTLVPNMATANSQRGDVYAGSAPSSHLRRHHERQTQSQSRRAREKRPQTGYRDQDEYAYTKVGFGSEYDSEYGTGYVDDYERGAYEPERSRTRDRYRDYRSEYREEQRPRVRRNSSASSRSLGDSDDQEYPPCVVVVERGRHGKKDTYYVIPGGAPVIFEDAKGNELTRVGDFTGRYRPRRQRPVIIEDSHGREIGRLGFDDESSLDYPYRHASSNSSGSEEDFYDRSRGSGYARQRSYRDDAHVSSSRHSSKHPSREEGRYSPPRGRSPPSNSSANVVYIPYTSSSTRAPSRHSGKSSRSGTGIREREYRDRDRDDAPYTYEPSTGSRSRSSHSHASRASSSQQVIHLDDHYTRQMSQSRSAASSRSSGRRSHDSDRHGRL